MEEVLISYAWNKPKNKKQFQDPIVERIVAALEENSFKPVIDKKEIQYKGDLRSFEERIGRGHKVVVVISDKYLKSPHCMYEMLCIYENGNIHDRIFPIALEDANIFNANGRLDYIHYWESQIAALDKKHKKLKSAANTAKVVEAINDYTAFRRIFDDISHVLSNMNLLKPEIHQESNFSELIQSIKGNRASMTSTSNSFNIKLAETRKLIDEAVKIIKHEIKEDGKEDDLLTKVKYLKTQCQEQSFQIAVMAMVKAGKSTFLNALLGRELLPTSNVPETAVPVRIIHSNSKEALLFHKDKEWQTASIRSQLLDANKKQRDKGLKGTIDFSLHASILCLSEREMGEVKFEILDTPGFGEALKEVNVGKSIDVSNDELIERISVIIYILDFTKLRTKHESEVLKRLGNIRPDLLDKMQERMFFIINRIDNQDRNSLSPEETVDYVFNHVKEKMPRVKKGQIFTLSASLALLSRLIKYNRATPQAKEDFARMVFGRVGSKNRTDAELKAAADEILEESNIIQIETNLIDFIYENRGKIFLSGLLDNLKRLLQEFRNKYIEVAQGTLKTTRTNIESLEKKIDAAKKKQESIQSQADKFETLVKDWIEVEFQVFERNIEDKIDSVFNEDLYEQKKRYSNTKVDDGWITRFKNKVISIFKSAKGESIENVAANVQKLNEEIFDDFYLDFKHFRNELEYQLFKKQKTLFAELKDTINSLARDFEGVVNTHLNINLEPIELKLGKELDFERLQMQADSVLERFIQRQPTVKNVKRQKEVVSKRWSGPDKVRIQTYFEPVFSDVYSISKEAVEFHWKSAVKEMNGNAKDATKHFINQNIREQIVRARNSFNQYTADYLLTIQNEKNRLFEGDVKQIQERLASLDALSSSTNALIESIDALNDEKNPISVTKKVEAVK